MILNYNGFKIVESLHIKEQPVIELSNSVNVSDKFRKECNDFYIKLFGFKEVAYLINKDTLAVSPKTLQAIKLEFRT